MPEDQDDRYALRYNRQRRLMNAPQAVKDMYARRDSGKRPGFFSMLSGNRGLKATFGAVILFAILAALIGFLNQKDKGVTLGPYRVKAEAAREGDGIAMSFSLSTSAAEAQETLSVRSSTDGVTFAAREFALKGDREERVFFMIPQKSASAYVECILGIGEKQLSMRIPVTGSAASSIPAPVAESPRP